MNFGYDAVWNDERILDLCNESHDLFVQQH